jgi:aspartate/glutamate racemase
MSAKHRNWLSISLACSEVSPMEAQNWPQYRHFLRRSVRQNWPRWPLPLISLLDAIAAEVQRCRLKRVAIFGARVTMETGLFGKLRGCDVIGLSNEETDLVSTIYGRIVEDGKASPADREQLRSLAHKLIERESLDAIVLAGTDLSFVFDEDNADFPHVDGARVHVKAIMNELLLPRGDLVSLNSAEGLQ